MSCSKRAGQKKKSWDIKFGSRTEGPDIATHIYIYIGHGPGSPSATTPVDRSSRPNAAPNRRRTPRPPQELDLSTSTMLPAAAPRVTHGVREQRAALPGGGRGVNFSCGLRSSSRCHVLLKGSFSILGSYYCVFHVPVLSKWVVGVVSTHAGGLWIRNNCFAKPMLARSTTEPRIDGVTAEFAFACLMNFGMHSRFGLPRFAPLPFSPASIS